MPNPSILTLIVFEISAFIRTDGQSHSLGKNLRRMRRSSPPQRPTWQTSRKRYVGGRQI